MHEITTNYARLTLLDEVKFPQYINAGISTGVNIHNNRLTTPVIIQPVKIILPASFFL